MMRMPQHNYPYTDMYELNLDFVLNKIVEVEARHTFILKGEYDESTKTLALKVTSLEEA